jgi:hypothetical protein
MRLGMFVAVASLGLVGCAGSSEYMREARPAASIAAPADQAVVVFVRPSGLAFAINFSIIDQAGHWMGDAVSQSHFAVIMPPGEYTFIGWAENTDLVKASLAPGHIYYVEVSPELGALYAQVSLEALTPRSDDWKNLPRWLADTKRLEPLPTGARSGRSTQRTGSRGVSSRSPPRGRASATVRLLSIPLHETPTSFRARPASTFRRA